MKKKMYVYKDLIVDHRSEPFFTHVIYLHFLCYKNWFFFYYMEAQKKITSY